MEPAQTCFPEEKDEQVLLNKDLSEYKAGKRPLGARFWSMLLTSVPFWVPIFDPQPFEQKTHLFGF